ncbi:hypothetical protein [Rheinheimera maricola]|uniref:Phage holin family protein n=1 Tax=Rheinheimera maricola TaxID=2793282 RepID=A0ABS7X354_9GAMM|nr:hypothetical protein [Rheinheimera maricola]MBZ9609991.1 hypothetical protein [Rheinheimera maricola]
MSGQDTTHSRETVQASEPAPADSDSLRSSNSMTEQALDQLTELAALSWSVSEHYSEQLKLTGQTAKAEWHLTGRSVAIAAGLLVCLGAGIILLWASVLALLGYLIFQATLSLSATAAVLLLLQSALLWWCWRSLGYVLSQVGFNATWQQLRRLWLAKDAPESGRESQAATAQQEQTNANR